MSIDSNSQIASGADIAEDVEIGPWCVIGDKVTIGAGSVIDSHVVIRANTRIGKNNRIFQFSSVGEDPSDKKFSGEETWLEIGDNNIIREGVTLHRGTDSGGGITRLGNDNLLLAYVHIAHDCLVGDNTVFANNCSISGHVEVSDWAILGGYAGIDQFCKIGAHAMVGGMTHVNKDVPAFVIVSGNPASVRSVNTIGLERRGYDKATIALIRKAFKLLYRRNNTLQEAIEQIKLMAGNCDALQIMIESLEAAERGIQR